MKTVKLLTEFKGAFKWWQLAIAFGGSIILGQCLRYLLPADVSHSIAAFLGLLLGGSAMFTAVEKTFTDYYEDDDSNSPNSSAE